MLARAGQLWEHILREAVHHLQRVLVRLAVATGEDQLVDPGRVVLRQAVDQLAGRADEQVEDE